MSTPDAQDAGHLFMNPWTPAPRQIACRRCRVRKKKAGQLVLRQTRSGIADICSSAIRNVQRAANAPSLEQHTHSSRSYVHALEEYVALLEARLRQSHPNIALDHLSPILRRASLLSGLPMDENAEEITYETVDYADENEGTLDFGDADPSEWMQAPMEGALMPANFGMANLQDDPMSGLVDPALGSMPTRILSLTDGDRDVEALIERPSALSSTLAGRHLAISIGSKYASEYFRNAHPMWPFLHQKQWDSCWRRWESPMDGGIGAAWMDFFADMVLSIGALLTQNSDQAPEHLESFKFLKARALEKYDSRNAQGWSALVRTQSSLLLTIQAMHLDSISTLRDRASEAIKQCTITKMQGPSNQMPCDPSGDIEPGSLLDNDDYFGDGSSPDTPRTLDHEDHMFQLRRIQCRILKMAQKLKNKAKRDGHPVPNLWRSQVRHDLNRWTDDIMMFSDSEGVADRFKSQQWLLKVANYAVISLFPNPYLAVRSGDARYLVAAACQVLVTFRRFRVKEHLSCYTWTALVHQFQAGVIVIYCLWATPTHQQLALYDRREVGQALFACLATLVDYANKWASAHVFQSIFSLLVDEIPISEYGDPIQQWAIAPDRCEELLKLTLELEQLQIQKKVVSILRDMAKGSRPCYMVPSIEETQWIQYTHPD
ncbi:putative Transcription factor domain-containing protein [Seiridium cardinale]